MDKDEPETFAEWFHAKYLEEFGPVDPKDKESVHHHRMLRGWCEGAWLHGRGSAYSGEGV
jgi:hypothetical protein